MGVCLGIARDLRAQANVNRVNMGILPWRISHCRLI
jgi:hypothetical protein